MRYVIVSTLISFSAVACADAAESGPVWPSTAIGYGLTTEAAKKDAMTEAVRLVTEYVQRLDPPLLAWQVTDDFIEKNLLDGDGTPGPDPKIANVHSWKLKLKPPNLEQLTRLNRQAIGARLLEERQLAARDRLLFAGCVLGGLSGLLALATAFFHFALAK